MSNPKADAVATFVVSPKNAALLLDVGLTQIYKLINAVEVESYRDGKSRKVVVASIEAYVARQIAAELTKPRAGWTDRATEARAVKRPGPRLPTGRVS